MPNQQPHITKLQQLANEKMIYQLMMDGWSAKRIVDKLMDEHGYRTQANARKIIDKVITNLKPKSEAELEMARDKYLEMYNDLYKRAIEAKEIRTAQLIMDSIVKLQGLAITKFEGKIDTTFEVLF